MSANPFLFDWCWWQRLSPAHDCVLSWRQFSPISQIPLFLTGRCATHFSVVQPSVRINTPTHSQHKFAGELITSAFYSLHEWVDFTYIPFQFPPGKCQSISQKGFAPRSAFTSKTYSIKKIGFELIQSHPGVVLSLRVCVMFHFIATIQNLFC